MDAAANGLVDIIKLLLERGARVDIQVRADGAYLSIHAHSLCRITMVGMQVIISLTFSIEVRHCQICRQTIDSTSQMSLNR